MTDLFTFPKAEAETVQTTNRSDQFGRLSGWVRVGDTRWCSEDWRGVRDHFWGVRPDVGGFGLPSRRRTEAALWQWLSAEADGSVVHVQGREGTVTIESVQRRIVSVKHDVTLTARRRDWTAARYLLTLDDGCESTAKAQAVLRQGTYRRAGYEQGCQDSRGVRGPGGSTLEYDVLDTSTAGAVTRDGEPYHPSPREQPARVLIGERSGRGHLMVMTAGDFPRYGLGSPSPATPKEPR